MLDMEARGAKTLDNYQNFAKAFKVRDFKASWPASRRRTTRGSRAQSNSVDSEMGDGSELYQSVLRAVLYAIMELHEEHRRRGSARPPHAQHSQLLRRHEPPRSWPSNLPTTWRSAWRVLRPDEASNARVLSELVKNHRIGCRSEPAS